MGTGQRIKHPLTIFYKIYLNYIWEGDYEYEYRRV